MAESLTGQGYFVRVTNPAQIHAFGRSELSGTKTDKADVKLIARYGLQARVDRWTPLPGNIRHLQAMTRRLEHLLEMLGMEQNRLGSADIAIIPSIDTVLATLNIELKATRQAIRAHVDLCPIGYNDPSLKQRSDLLESIPGTSPATIPYLLVAMSPNHGYPTPNNSSPMPDLPLPSASPDNGKAKPDLPKTETPDCARRFICQL